MSDLTDEEIKKFILENRDRVLDILEENVPRVEEDVDRAFEHAEKVKAKVSEKKEAAEDVAKGVYAAVMSPEVHKHFIKMGMEFFLGLNELADRLPVPDGIRRIRDDVDRTETEIRKEMCRNNPDCLRKQKDEEPELEKIELD